MLIRGVFWFVVLRMWTGGSEGNTGTPCASALWWNGPFGYRHRNFNLGGIKSAGTTSAVSGLSQSQISMFSNGDLKNELRFGQWA